MLNVIMLDVAFNVAERRPAECHYVERRYEECRYPECRCAVIYGRTKKADAEACSIQ